MLTGSDPKLTRKVVVCAVLTVIVFCVSLTVRLNAAGFMNPGDLVATLGGIFQIDVLGALSNNSATERLELIAQYPLYYEVKRRIGISFVTLLCGGLLALAGMVYQNVFRNPIAAPTMLGTTSGIQLGVVALVLQYGAMAVTVPEVRYLYCFIGGIVVLAAVFGLTRLICGKRGMNVVNLLLVGSMVTVAANAISGYFVDLWNGTDLWDAYYAITQSLAVQTDPIAIVSLAAAFVVGFVPLYMMRFSMNMISFDDVEARMAGVRPARLRWIALAAGTLMILAAQIQVGAISLISLIVPFLVRRAFGATFGKQLAGNLALGPLVLLLCRTITDLIPFVGEGFPMTVVVSIVALPLFVWAMAITQRDWGE